MFFWGRNIYNFIITVISLFLEFFLIFFFGGLKPLVVLFALSPLYILLSYSLKNNFNFQSHLLNSLLFYMQFAVSSYLMNYFLSNVYALDLIKSIEISAMAFSLNIFIKIFGFISLKAKKIQKALICKENSQNCTYMLENIICKVFYINHYSIDSLHKAIENKKFQEIYIDTLENLEELINKKPLIDHQINCIEAGNKSILDYFIEKNKIKTSNLKDESFYFSGAKVLIIGNNQKLIKSFISKSLKYDCHSIMILSDSLEICENFNKICKTYHYNKDFRFKEMESKFQVDIIFDTFIIESYNFITYRSIARDLSDNIKNKKAIVSLKQKGINVENWLLNSAKELIVKKLYDGTFGLTAISYTIGEFQSNTSLSYVDNLLVFDNFYIQNTDEIAEKSWYLVNNIEKSSFNSIGNMVTETIKSSRILRLLEQTQGVEIKYEIFQESPEDFELINSLFMRHKTTFSHFAKSLTEDILDKNPINYEDIARAIVC